MAVDTLAEGQPEIIFIGSSHIYTGVDPAEFDKPTVNIADSGLNYEVAEVLCTKYWSSIANARRVVIELDAIPVCTDTIARRRGDFREFYEWGLSAAELPLSPLDKVTTAISEQFTVTRRKRVWPALLHEHEGADEYTRPGFHARLSTLPEAQKETFFAALTYKAEEAQVVRNLEALERLVRNLLREGIQPVFYRPPYHSEYWSQPAAFAGDAYVKQAIDMISTEFSDQHFTTLDYSQIFSSGNEQLLFADWTHVSARGATLASKRLSVDMTGL